jgi:PTH1 family peptidyl-tRNA hydrolase
VDGLARELKAPWVDDRSHFGRVARAQIKGQGIWLLQPQTFMNLSGKSVGALSRFFKIAPASILVVHDELDLPPGEAKLKFGGGHAGHNGLRDIHAQLGTADYWRLRIGIGHPGDKSEVAGWVLRKPPAEQREAIEACVARTLTAWPDLVAGETTRATQKIHTSKTPRPKPIRKPESDAPN